MSADPTAHHELKVWPDYFDALVSGAKPFDVRSESDRLFGVGDIVTFREFDDKAETYTGRTLTQSITYVLRGVGAGAIAPLRGVARGYVVLGFGRKL